MTPLNFNICIFFFVIAQCLAATETTTSSSTSTSTTKTSTSTTYVWVTDTDSAGKTVTTQSPYYQLFKSAYTTATGTVLSGSIGVTADALLVGEIRTYSSTTVSGGGSAPYYHLIIGNQKVISYKAALISSAFLVTLLVM